MEQRELGRTGHRSTLVPFGTAGLGRVEQDMADKAIEAVPCGGHYPNPVHTAPSAGDVNLLPRVLAAAE